MQPTCAPGFFEQSGQFGDTVGGVANLIMLGIVAYVTWSTVPRALAQARREHAMETQAASALEIFRAVYDLFQAMYELVEAEIAMRPHHATVTGDHVMAKLKSRIDQLESAARGLRRAMGVAALHLTKEDILMLGRFHAAMWEHRAVFDRYVRSIRGFECDEKAKADATGPEKGATAGKALEEILVRLREFAIPETKKKAKQKPTNSDAPPPPQSS